jgi:hypothetical protein
VAKTFKQRLAERMCPKCHGRLTRDRFGFIRCAEGTHVKEVCNDLRGFPLRNQPPTVTLQMDYYLTANMDFNTRYQNEQIINRIIRRNISGIRKDLKAAGLLMKVAK